MAAIFGVLGDTKECLSELKLMAGALSHRGNGPPKIFEFAVGGIGCRQSGIQDHRNTGCCAVSADGDIYVLLDGMLTNADVLRAGIEASGNNDVGESDADLLLELYRQQGAGLIESLRGSFAIAIWDSSKQYLVLARDHIGHKLLFFADNGNRFYFASEAKALLAAGAVPFAMDMEALTHFLSFRFVPAPRSMVKGIAKLAPAHCLTRQKQVINLRRYWYPSFGNKSALSADELIDGLENKLLETTASNMRHEVNTGCLLSGGLDSGLLVANMAQVLGVPFDTFTLGVDNKSDEVPRARLVSTTFSTKQHEMYATKDIVRQLPAAVWHADEPSDMLNVTKYILSGMAAPYVDAVMSGDGGDEVFAGFPRFRGIRDAQYFGLLPAIIRNALIAPAARKLGGRQGLHTAAGKILWLSDVTGAGRLGERYAAAVEYLRFRTEYKKTLFTEDGWRQVSEIESGKLLADIVDASDADDPIEKLLYAEIMTRLPEQLLMLNDRMGAAHGVDVLSPMADKELIEFAASIPVRMKLHGREAKYIERRLAERSLPTEVARFAKTGWTFPFADLFAGQLQPFLRSVLSDSQLVQDGIFRADAIELILDEHGSRVANHHIRIWMLLSLEIWYRMTSAGLHYKDMDPWLETHLGAHR